MSKRQDAQTGTLIQRLRCCRGLERFGEKDLRDMEWPKVEKIFVELFMRVGEKALRDCAEEREVRGLKHWPLVCNLPLDL